MKNQIIRALEIRVQMFEKLNHSYEARELRSAIDTIRRLVPPTILEIKN
jgi:hypothetical protein